jgi:hypothetical protein
VPLSFASSGWRAILDPSCAAAASGRLTQKHNQNGQSHPQRRGAQRTNADLIGVRFPYRAERLFDVPNDIMADDVQRLTLSDRLIDVLIGGKAESAVYFERPLDPPRESKHSPRAGGDLRQLMADNDAVSRELRNEENITRSTDAR